jgi:hypothetical protein
MSHHINRFFVVLSADGVVIQPATHGTPLESQTSDRKSSCIYNEILTALNICHNLVTGNSRLHGSE